jgi:hypothetical protein
MQFSAREGVHKNLRVTGNAVDYCGIWLNFDRIVPQLTSAGGLRRRTRVLSES